MRGEYGGGAGEMLRGEQRALRGEEEIGKVCMGSCRVGKGPDPAGQIGKVETRGIARM